MAVRTRGSTVFWTKGPPFLTASTPRPMPMTTPRIPESAPSDRLEDVSRTLSGYPRGGGENADAIVRLWPQSALLY
jgi:hypothetical protein